jgi:hypothetical protein
MTVRKRWTHFPKGITSATAFDTGKVLNMKIISQFCFVCYTNPPSEYNCKKKYEGTSGGMEISDLLNNCSVCTKGICYTKYLGDVESKTTKG